MVSRVLEPRVGPGKWASSWDAGREGTCPKTISLLFEYLNGARNSAAMAQRTVAVVDELRAEAALGVHHGRRRGAVGLGGAVIAPESFCLHAVASGDPR